MSKLKKCLSFLYKRSLTLIRMVTGTDSITPPKLHSLTSETYSYATKPIEIYNNLAIPENCPLKFFQLFFSSVLIVRVLVKRQQKSIATCTVFGDILHTQAQKLPHLYKFRTNLVYGPLADDLDQQVDQVGQLPYPLQNLLLFCVVLFHLLFLC